MIILSHQHVMMIFSDNIMIFIILPHTEIWFANKLNNDSNWNECSYLIFVKTSSNSQKPCFVSLYLTVQMTDSIIFTKRHNCIRWTWSHQCTLLHQCILLHQYSCNITIPHPLCFSNIFYSSNACIIFQRYCNIMYNVFHYNI